VTIESILKPEKALFKKLINVSLKIRDKKSAVEFFRNPTEKNP